MFDWVQEASDPQGQILMSWTKVVLDFLGHVAGRLGKLSAAGKVGVR